MRFEPDPFDYGLPAQQDAILALDHGDVTVNYNKWIVLLYLCRSEEALAHFERALRRPACHSPLLHQL